MKKRLLTLLLLAITHVLFAQDGTQVEYTVDIDTTSAPKRRLLDTYGDVFQTQVPVRSVFKIMVPFGLPKYLVPAQLNVPKAFRMNAARQITDILRLGYERKIRADWSINAEVAIAQSEVSSVLYPYNVRLLVQPRWYYRMGQRIQEGKSVANVSDNYLGVSLETTWNVLADDVWLKNTQGLGFASQELSLVYGLQRRFQKHGFADFSIRAGVIHERFPRDVLYQGFDTPFEKQWSWFIETRTLGGFALTRNSQTTSSQCEILNCFEPVRSLLKVDLNNPIRLSSTGHNVRGSMAYERKLGKSPFSIQAELSVHARLFSRKLTFYETPGWLDTVRDVLGEKLRYRNGLIQASLSLESRYYYNMNKRIRQGKQGDNLSGNFLHLGISTEHLQERTKGFEPAMLVANQKGTGTYTRDISVTFADVYVGWGMQRRLFTNGYWELKTGLRLPFYDRKENRLKQRQVYRSMEVKELVSQSTSVPYSRKELDFPTLYPYGFIDLKIGLAQAKRK